MMFAIHRPLRIGVPEQATDGRLRTPHTEEPYTMAAKKTAKKSAKKKSTKKTAKKAKR